MSSTTVTEYGVRYPDGKEDWNTRNWFGHIETRDMRESFQEQYNLRLGSYGMPPMKVTFLKRDITVTTSDVVVVDDSATPDPEPNTDGEDELASDTDAAPPADTPVTEEESPVEEPSVPTEESNDTGK